MIDAKNINPHLLLIVLWLFISCGNEKNIKTETGQDIKIYFSHYNYNFNGKYLINTNDTIDITLGDTICLSIETTNEFASLLFTENSIEIIGNVENQNGYEYTAIAEKAGLATMYISSLQIIFYLKIKSTGTSYTILETPLSVVEVQDKKLKNKIESDLDSVSIPQFLDTYRLIYITQNEGKAELVNLRTPSDTIKGTFNINPPNIEVYFNNGLSYNFIEIEQEPEAILPYFLQQDFTEEFQLKYTSEEINEVIVLSGVSKLDIYDFD